MTQGPGQLRARHTLHTRDGSAGGAGRRGGTYGLPAEGREAPEGRGPAVVPGAAGCLALWASGEGPRLQRGRRRVESAFARLTNTPGLLGPLPNWVRRLRRVTLWVGMKLLIDTVRLVRKQRLTA